MSFDLVRRVRDLRELKSPAKAILLCLALRANEARQCWPSLRTIAGDAGYDVSTVKRSLAVLADTGLVRRETRLDAEHGDPSSTLYTLNVGADSADPGAASASPPSGLAQRAPTGLASTAPGGVASTAPRRSITESPDLKPQDQGRGRRLGSRLDADWMPNAALVDFARAAGVVDLEATVAEFRDYWCAVPGQRGVKLDWDATFRNSIRHTAARRSGGSRSGESARMKQPLGNTSGWNKPIVAKPGDEPWDGKALAWDS